MKRLWVLVIMGLLLLPGVVGAAGTGTIELDNYYYAHANKPGTYLLHDKYNHTLLYGDYDENDATVSSLMFRNWNGMEGETLRVTDANGTVTIIPNNSIAFSTGDPEPKYVKIEMIKTTYNESFVEVSVMNTLDPDYTAGRLTYIFMGTTPTKYGDLGKGSATPTATPTPTPTPTPAPTPTPTPTPQVGNLMAYKSGNQIVWPSEPSNTERIDVYKNGVKVASVPAGAKYYNFPDPSNTDGTYTLKAVSTQGNVIAQTTLILNGNISPTPEPTTTGPTSTPGPTDPGGGTSEPECPAGCQALKDMLECPEWDTYMGEWADMIASVIPPPPDWNMVADKIGASTINYLANWAGSVPAPPTKEEIENETAASLPSLDTSVETNGLVPQVPGDYNNGPIDFDLNKDAPTIEVIDESQPFTILDPLANMPHDDPGVKVFPGDPRNSTGGFKQPDKVDTGDPAPTPGKIVFDLPRPSPPAPVSSPNPAPTPGGGIVFDLPRPSPKATTGPPPTPGKIIFDLPPIPGNTASEVPTPELTDGIIPIPKGGG